LNEKGGIVFGKKKKKETKQINGRGRRQRFGHAETHAKKRGGGGGGAGKSFVVLPRRPGPVKGEKNQRRTKKRFVVRKLVFFRNRDLATRKGEGTDS